MTRLASIALAACARSYATTWCRSSRSTEILLSFRDISARLVRPASTSVAAASMAVSAALRWSDMAACYRRVAVDTCRARVDRRVQVLDVVELLVVLVVDD